MLQLIMNSFFFANYKIKIKLVHFAHMSQINKC